MRSTFFPPAAWGTHQTVIIHILQIPSIFHFPYCISTVRADSFPRSHGGNTTRYAPNFTIPTLFLTLLIEPHAADFLSPAAWGTHIKLLTSISNSLIYLKVRSHVLLWLRTLLYAILLFFRFKQIRFPLRANALIQTVPVLRFADIGYFNFILLIGNCPCAEYFWRFEVQGGFFGTF